MESMEINLEDIEEDIRILLIGVTRYGKSSTGISILGEPQFEARGGWTSVTREFHIGMTNINGRLVKVVDTPGFKDTELRQREEQLNLVVDELTKALVQFPDGFDAIVIVIPYTARLDDEEKRTINTMVSLMGHQSVESHGIIAMSHGDAYRRDYPDRNVADWLEDLPSNHQWVNALCHKRCVLFDNVTTDNNVKDSQRHNLINIIDNLGTRNRYIPEICLVPVERRHIEIRYREKVIKYIKGLNALDVLRYKLQMAIRDEETFDIRAERLRTDAKRIVQMFTSDGVFGADELQTLLNKMNSLNQRAPFLHNAANEIHEAVLSLQNKIHTKMASTEYWQNLRRRIADFFERIYTYSNCVIL